MKFSASRVAVATLISSTFALPTWPASTDEVEELLFQVSGYKSRGLADLVTPCSKSPAGPGRIAAAEWLRTAFHDMSTFGVDGPGTGGLDASLVFELTIPQNRSPAFSTTLKNLAAFYGAHASMADIIALGTYASVRSCGGPSIPIRAGRIDATASGPRGVPDPDNTISSFKTQFKRMGFTDAEMVEITACGHTLGGVHSGPFPQIVPRGTAPNDYKLFDDPTDAGSRFDNRIAVDYLAGNTTNPLATGPSVQNGFDSDRRIFQVDGDATVRKLADARVFQEQCRLVLAKMLDTVPTGVVLSEVVKAYEVKPVGVQLTLVNGGADLKFEGEIRVRTTSNKGVTGASVVYKKRDGSAGGTITTTLSGTGAGFDETFSFYKFSTTLPASSSISSFTVQVSGGSTQGAYNNNGAGFPVNDMIIYQSPQSCLATATNGQRQRQLTVVAAVRNGVQGSPSVELQEKVERDGIVVPALVRTSAAMTKGSPAGPLYTLYTVTTPIGSTLSALGTFDVSVGGEKDAFKKVAGLGNACAPFPGGSASSTSSSSASAPTTAPPSSTTTPPASTTLTSSTTAPPSTASPTSTPTPTPTGWHALGCFADSVRSRTLPHPFSLPFPLSLFTPLTTARCQAACKSAGYDLAGTEFGRECWCGRAAGWAGTPAQSGCDMPCSGARGEICGGRDRISVSRFESGGSGGGAPGNPKVVGKYTYLGCRGDSVFARALGDAVQVSSEMTLERCAEFCGKAKRGGQAFRYAGAEFGRECWCGDGLGRRGEGRPERECDVRCAGNGGQFCGGGSRLSVYKLTGSN